MLRNRTIALLASLVAVTSACAANSGAENAAASRVDPESGFSGRTVAGNVAHGATIFAEDCASCHGTGGRSGGIGPSLVDENQREDLAHTIFAVTNPYPGMPARYPRPLEKNDVADVAAFVQTIR